MNTIMNSVKSATKNLIIFSKSKDIVNICKGMDSTQSCELINTVANNMMIITDSNEHPIVRVLALVLSVSSKDSNGTVIAALIVGNGWMSSKKPLRSLVKRVGLLGIQRIAQVCNK